MKPIAALFAAALFNGALFTAALTTDMGLAMAGQTQGVPAVKAAGGASTDKPAVLLRSNVVVNHDQVYLSDLFDGVPAELDRVVSASPAPGRAQLFTWGLLRKVAKESGLAWESGHPRSKVRLERAGEPISKERVIGELVLALQDSGVTGGFEVEIYNRFVNAILPRGMAYGLFVEAMEHSTRDGRLAATVRIEAENGQDFTARVMGRVHPLVTMPVLVRSVLPGDIIKTSDLGWMEKRAQQVIRTAVSDPADIVGMKAKRALTPGTPILHSDIKPNMLVERRDLVTLVVNSPVMRLTAKGVATEPGALGDVIRIRNTVSNRVIEGRVIAAGVVEVMVGAQLARLSQ
ncbi:MAG: flagellar basal body P-ring formation chaperone FlgA [Alphaproteobacteria bacterium]|nr:flagellar basal body P-ring formation chaperone FlgA [Alphaproteobacteria bacterium]